MTTRATVLLVEDDDAMRVLLEEELGDHGYLVMTASRAADALEMLARAPVDVVVSDVVMPGMHGSELLARIRREHPGVPVVLMTAFATVESAVEHMKLGAAHYLMKPFRMEALATVVESALRERRVALALAPPGAAPGNGPEEIVGRGPAMQRALDELLRAATSPSPVLLLGESGTGKELFARALHAAGTRRSGPFVAVNCSAIPETLLESQLFGHLRGAFTDAREDRDGLVRSAEGGSLFLDEIGDLALGVQGRLLRLLQEREVLPLGATRPVPVDARVIAATHRDLEARRASGTFREDLYYRLNVLTITLPPLRERSEDLVPLVAHFLDKHGRALGREGWTLAPATLEALRAHDWPGNVRELENAIHRALVMGSNGVLGVADLPRIGMGGTAAKPDAGAAVRPLAEVEREQIVRALRAARGNKAAAARLLGLDRKTLYRRLEAFAIRDTELR